MRAPSHDEICAFCTDFTRKDVEPQYAELGMGRCHGFDQDENSPKRYVAWNETCVLFDKDRSNVHARRQFANKCRTEGVPE